MAVVSKIVSTEKRHPLTTLKFSEKEEATELCKIEDYKTSQASTAEIQQG